MNASLPANILTTFDQSVRRKPSVLAGTFRTDVSNGVHRVIGPSPSEWLNWIGYHDFPAQEMESRISEQIDFYRSAGHGFRWKIYAHDPLASELSVALLRHGFIKSEKVALIVAEAAKCRQNVPEGITYEKVTRPESLARELKPVTEQVWDDGADESVAAFSTELRDMGDHIVIFTAKENGETVGCGIVRYNRDFTFGGLFAGSTVPAARRRGIFSGMIGVRARHAMEFGTRYLYTEAGTMSRPILEANGFTEISSITNYILKPPRG